MLIQLEPRKTSSLKQMSADIQLPSVVDEMLVRKFKYWNQSLQQGMCYQDSLYTYCQSYSVEDRLKAYTVGCEYTEQGISTCITVSKAGYSVWVKLQASE